MSRSPPLPDPFNTSGYDICLCHHNVSNIVLKHLDIKNYSILQTTQIICFKEIMLESNEKVTSSGQVCQMTCWFSGVITTSSGGRCAWSPENVPTQEDAYALYCHRSKLYIYCCSDNCLHHCSVPSIVAQCKALHCRLNHHI